MCRSFHALRRELERSDHLANKALQLVDVSCLKSIYIASRCVEFVCTFFCFNKNLQNKFYNLIENSLRIMVRDKCAMMFCKAQMMIQNNTHYPHC